MGLSHTQANSVVEIIKISVLGEVLATYLSNYK